MPGILGIYRIIGNICHIYPLKYDNSARNIGNIQCTWIYLPTIITISSRIEDICQEYYKDLL